MQMAHSDMENTTSMKDSLDSNTAVPSINLQHMRQPTTEQKWLECGGHLDSNFFVEAKTSRTWYFGRLQSKSRSRVQQQ